MANTSPSEKTIKELFIGNCWEYLNNNFHKFSETNKIKIALELCKKDVAQKIDGNINANIVAMGEVVKDGVEILEFKIGGKPNTPAHSEHTGQAPSDSLSV